MLFRPDHPKTAAFAPAMAEGTGNLPGLPVVAVQPVPVGFDGGRLLQGVSAVSAPLTLLPIS